MQTVGTRGDAFVIHLRVFVFNQLSQLLVIFRIGVDAVSQENQFLHTGNHPAHQLHVFFQIDGGVHVGEIELFCQFAHVCLFFGGDCISLPVEFLMVHIGVGSAYNGRYFTP